MSWDATRRLLTDRRALLGGAAALGVGGALAALSSCGRTEAPVDEQGRVRLRFATDWRAQAEHGGFYMALATGA
ncbi:MAG: ABC transporter substrate-binding protein, partial [Brevundimonas sp.]